MKDIQIRRGPKTLKVVGTIVGGLGESASFLSIRWVKDQLLTKLRFEPFCGTLNIDVRDSRIQRILRRRGIERIVPEEQGFCDALLFSGTVSGRYPCGIVLPLVPDYPENVLEVVAPVHLKEALHMEDGEEIEVELQY